MSNKIDRSLIRNLVREVITEVVAGKDEKGQGQPLTSPSTRKPVIEEVAIRNDAELSQFVKHLLALSKNTETWLAVEEGTWNFRIKSGATSAEQNTSPSTTVGKLVRIEKGVIGEKRIAALAKDGFNRIALGRSAVLTPLGRDKARQLNITMEREKR